MAEQKDMGKPPAPDTPDGPPVPGGDRGGLPADGAAILAVVGAVGVRLRRQRGLRRLLWGACLGLAVGLMILLIGRWAGLGVGWSKAVCPLCGVVGGLLFLFLFVRRGRLSSRQAAKLADDRLGLKDQLANAFEFAERQREDAVAALTLEQTAARLDSRKAVRQAVPWRTPAVLWLLLAAAVTCWGTQRALFSEQERRQEEVSADLGASLLSYAADVTGVDEAQFQASLALMEELQMLSAKAGKEEILARLSRMIEEADDSDDEAMKQHLAGLKKLKQDFAMGELRRELQEELDKGHDELAVTDEDGTQVKAMEITTLALAEKREKQAELAREVKQVARELREKAREDKEAAAEWAVDVAEKTADGQKKVLKKQTVASYQDIAQLVENRDIRRMILAAASDRTRTTTDYREVFENYRRMMRTFLFSRNLPGGQAEYIDRYFRVIHPKETEKEDGR